MKNEMINIEVQLDLSASGVVVLVCGTASGDDCAVTDATRHVTKMIARAMGWCDLHGDCYQRRCPLLNPAL